MTKDQYRERMKALRPLLKMILRGGRLTLSRADPAISDIYLAAANNSTVYMAEINPPEAAQLIVEGLNLLAELDEQLRS